LRLAFPMAGILFLKLRINAPFIHIQKYHTHEIEQ